MESGGSDKCQIFVKGLPADTTKEALEDYFSDVGPIKRCFLVNKPNEKVFSGIAYIWFALPQHAKESVQKKNGQMFGGKKKIFVEIAKPKLQKPDQNSNKDSVSATTIKVKQEETSDNENTTIPTPTPSKQQPVTTTPTTSFNNNNRSKPNEIVIIVNNFTKDKNEIEGLLKLNQGVIKAVFPIPYSDSSVRIICMKEEDAKVVSDKLSSTKYHNKKIIFKRESQELKSQELILRNLSFKITKEEIISKFKTLGEILLVKLPVKDDTQQSKGFGFVMYLNRDSAEKAINQLNGIKLDQRQIAIDW
eukprot:gene5178-6446_t